ncbi:MAG: NAD(P)/FAD-dependent oxidoreductase [Candidatus Thermoplasmatota archaeon]|nr:NAD(P)/FAD-dependent oxidoreductase [Candidatus Thermoplasmatota archaeon]
MRNFDVAIVGAGPAGIAAGIQLVRYGWKVILVERKRPGGLLWNANLVENYPGFPGGIAGAQLAQRMVEQVGKEGLDIVEGECRAIGATSKGFDLDIDGKEGLAARLVLVATGTRPKVASFAGEEHLPPLLLVYEVADLPEDLSGKNILVSGGGEAAFDYALSIVYRGGKATICHRSTSPKAMLLLVNRCKERGVEFLPGVDILSVERSGKSVMTHLSNGFSLIFDNIIAAHGREPELPILPKNNPGIFMVGDVTAGRNRQTAIAVGGGVRAAMEMDMLLRQNPQRGWRSGMKKREEA